MSDGLTTIPPLARDPRYRLLDVWRGVAGLMVILYHAGFAIYHDPKASVEGGSPAGYGLASLLWRLNLGVPLFFVISGYCIAASADATRRRGSGAWRFLGRRIWRIYPPYWASLFVFVAATSGLDALGLSRLHGGNGAVALQLDSPGVLDAAQWVGNLTLTEEWRPIAWGTRQRLVYTRVAWSLCYEEQFYFVCFLALLAAPRRLYGTLGALTLAIVGVRVVAGDIGLLPRIEGTFPILWHEFAVGLAVYYRLNVPLSAPRKRAVELGLLGLMLIGTTHLKHHTPVEYSTTAAAAFGLILIALRRWDDRASRLRILAPLRACGRRCYSLYLIHLPVCVIVVLALHELGLTGFWTRALVLVPVASTAAVGAGWLFFHVVERHFLNPPIVGDRRRVGVEEPPLAGEVGLGDESERHRNTGKS